MAYNADPELAKTFAIADIYANVQGESTYLSGDGWDQDHVICLLLLAF